MPTIQMLFDDSVVRESEIHRLGVFLRELCINSKNLDVKVCFAYAECPKIKINLLPIEIYVKITRRKILNETAFLEEIETKLKTWKVKEGFKHPVNVLLIPMDWKILDSI
jgi:hypothetical protein